MKAVILAAGRGGRMSPLTDNLPKPLLQVNGKALIDYVLESFPPEIDEVIITVKYLAEQIKAHVGEKNRGMKINYVQGSNKGTAYSFLATKSYFGNERFLFVQGDEIPDPIDVKNCLSKDLSILVFRTQTPKVSGIAYLRKDGTIERIDEKPKNPKSNLAADGVMVLNSDIFRYKPSLINGEYYFSTMVDSFVRDHKVLPVTARDFVGGFTTPDDLEIVGNILKKKLGKTSNNHS